MNRHQCFALLLATCLLANAFSLPSHPAESRKRRDVADNSTSSTNNMIPDEIPKVGDDKTNDSKSSDDTKLTANDDVDDDDEDFGDDSSTTTNNGSNMFSLLNLISSVLPSLSGSDNIKKNNDFVKKVIKDVINRYKAQKIQKRQDFSENVIPLDYEREIKPSILQRQDSEEDDNGSSSEENGNSEESGESNENGGSKSKQDSNEDGGDSSNDSDYDEPPGGDGEGGGILGLLSGLSGDGESDLGTLLATVGGIVTSLSGDGVDLNAIIATALGLFVGLLSEENSKPGDVIGSYLLTSLDTITGGGAMNNGQFFGNFLSTLLKGTSAGGDSNSNSGSDENGGGGKMTDSVGFFWSLLTGLLGDMSAQSSGGSSGH